MNILAFEEGLIEKLSKELDKPENWKNGTSTIKHITKNYIIFFSNYDDYISLIAPACYNFQYKNLTQECGKKVKNIYDINRKLELKLMEENARLALIKEFELDTRASKLKALNKISEQPEIKTLEELILPKKKKSWRNWFKTSFFN